MNDRQIGDIHDLIEASEVVASDICGAFDEVWWRGHAVSSWQLLPSVFREDRKSWERQLSLAFLRQAPCRMDAPPPEGAWPEWLFVMQHHGLPTRLLDWTSSALVAAYFAVAEQPPRDAALWAINPQEFNEDQGAAHSVRDPHDELLRDFFAEPFVPANPDERIVAVRPPLTHIRMLVQGGACTIHTSPQPIEEAASAYLIRRFIIPAAAKPQLKESLARLGISRSRLFPELPSLAEDLREQFGKARGRL
jgi:hypothetical protein